MTTVRTGAWATRDRVVAAFGELAATRPLAAIGMAELAAAAGLTRRSLYNHVADLAELTGWWADAALARLEALLPCPLQDGALAGALARFAGQAALLLQDRDFRTLRRSAGWEPDRLPAAASARLWALETALWSRLDDRLPPTTAEPLRYIIEGVAVARDAGRTLPLLTLIDALLATPTHPALIAA